MPRQSAYSPRISGYRGKTITIAPPFVFSIGTGPW
jgi:hypothetical protein